MGSTVFPVIQGGTRHGFHLRTDAVTPSHTTLTIFANGGNCGYLTLRNNEAEAFISCLRQGCKGLVVDFVHTAFLEVVCPGGKNEDDCLYPLCTCNIPSRR